MRAGASALSLLSLPLNLHVLQTLEEEPRPLSDLRRTVGTPPQTTMRGRLKTLIQAGTLERSQEREFPGSVRYELTQPGRDLLAVATTLESWLEGGPGGPFPLGGSGAKSATKAFVEAWSCGIIRALAARPLALTELSKLISGLSYPSLERRLSALHMTGQIERCSSTGRGTPYKATDWLRRAMAPLVVAVRWERLHLPKAGAPLKPLDIESIFLLTVPLLPSLGDLGGTCRLAVEFPTEGQSSRLAGVLVSLEKGRLNSCSSRLDGEARAWTAGTASVWLRALIDGDFDGLELGGDTELARVLIEAMHQVLFGASAPTRVLSRASA